MRYISHDANGFMSYDKYFQYLESVRSDLGEKLYLFASNPDRHDLRSKESLHDSWVKTLFVKSFYETLTNDLTKPDVELVLIGPYHDRTHVLSYFKVKKCTLDFEFCNDGRKRDLLYHELRYEKGFLEHEIVFDGDMVIEVVCEDMTHAEQRV